MRRRTTSILLLLLATLAGPPAQAGPSGLRSSSSIRWDDGSRAPDDTWPQDDGCPARTGATETPAITGPREVAWRFNVPGEIEGEPVAWKSKTYVVERAGAKRILHVLATATGVEKTKLAFDTPLPTAPSVADGRVVLRTSPKTIQGFTFGEKGLVSRWTLAAKTAVGPATVLRDEVYVVVDGVLQRRTFGSAEPVWPKAGASSALKVEGASVAGTGAPAKGAASSATEYPRPSVRGNSVFLATGHRLVELDRREGTLVREIVLDTDADPKTSRVQVGFADVMVVLGKHFRERDHDVDTCRIGLGDPGRPFEKRQSLSLPNGIASLGRNWVGVHAKEGSKVSLSILEGSDTSDDDAFDLATPALHAEFLESKAPPTTSYDVALVAGRMFDAETHALVNPDGLPSISRTIPLRDRLLAVETKSRVTAWKSTRAPEALPPFSALPTDAIPPSHAVVEDGRVVAGGFSIDAKTGALRAAGKPGEGGSWPIASVRVLWTDQPPRRLLLAARPEDAAAGVAAIARGAAASDLLALVADAVLAGDAELARRAHTAAAERGAPEAELEKADKAVAALAAKGGDRDEARCDEVKQRLSALVGREADALVEAASSIPAGTPLAYATTLVRAAVDRSPFHAGATEWVRTHLPAGLSPKGFRDLGDWLDFLVIHAATKLRVLGPHEKAQDDVPEAVTRALAVARSSWRDDLVGFQNGPLLVVSPPEHPSAIAKCLTLGRIVCDALDASFASVGPRRTESEILVLHLFPSKAEYLAHSRDGRDEEPGGFGHLDDTAGHYDQVANVTRIFFPSSGETNSVVDTYTHELTHHWIARRRPPRPTDADLGDAAGGPGYFIVEGFADFVKDFDYDLLGVKADPQNARAGYADIVAGTAEADLVPWEKVLTWTQREAYSLPAKGEIKVARRWRMGLSEHYSKILLFYAQSASATAYLFLAEGGKYRAALLEYLYTHYAGAPDMDGLWKAVGASPAELGPKIVLWCRSLAAPPAPPAPPKKK